MESARYRIEIFHTSHDNRGQAIQKKLKSLGFTVSNACITDNYLVNGDISEDEAARIARSLLQPVTQDYRINEPCNPGEFTHALEVGFLPGVTDNVSHTVRESIEDLLKKSLDHEKSVFSSVTYFFKLDDPGQIHPEPRLGQRAHQGARESAGFACGWQESVAHPDRGARSGQWRADRAERRGCRRGTDRAAAFLIKRSSDAPLVG